MQGHYFSLALPLNETAELLQERRGIEGLRVSETARSDLIAARDPGAHRVVYRFVSGFLFSSDITRVYESLTMPVWTSHGIRGDFTDYRYALAFSTRPNWSFDILETGALPHFEVPAKSMARYGAFLAGAAG